MQKNKTLTTLAGALLLIAMCPSKATAATAYFGFTRLDPATKKITKQSYVVVEGQRIIGVGRGAPPKHQGWDYVDMSGRYALPGLFDVHAHITIGPFSVQVKDGTPTVSMQSNESIARFNGLVALASGVTTIRNPAGDPVANANYDAKVRSGEWAGPDALHAGFTFDTSPFEGLSVHPKNLEEWNREVERQKSLGMTYIKLYSGLSESELATGIQVAHAHAMKAIAHLDRVSWTRAIELGIDALTHALPTSEDLLPEMKKDAYVKTRVATSAKFMYQWFELADYDSAPFKRLVRLLRERRIPVDLTLRANELIYFYDDVDAVLPTADRPLMHPALLKSWFQSMTASHHDWTKDDYRSAHAVMPKVLQLARRFFDAGVPLSLGTDGTGGGPDYDRELALHVQAGISVWNVLQLATNLAAQRLGVADKTGTIEIGKEADIVFLKANPLDRIENIRLVDTVITNGTARRAADLIEQSASLARESQ